MDRRRGAHLPLGGRGPKGGPCGPSDNFVI